MRYDSELMNRQLILSCPIDTAACAQAGDTLWDRNEMTAIGFLLEEVYPYRLIRFEQIGIRNRCGQSSHCKSLLKRMVNSTSCFGMC
jgi:hypothetical protein